jgi:hypothetical protein
MKIVGMFKNWLNLVSTFLLQDQFLEQCTEKTSYSSSAESTFLSLITIHDAGIDV